MFDTSSNPASTSGGTLPLDPTPAFPSGLKGRHADRSSYLQHDFLKGEGPSSQEHYYDPLEKKAFKPGWKTMRPQSQIKPYEERMSQQAARDARSQVVNEARCASMKERSLRGAFNPITGQEYNAAAASWQPASDPWQHRKPSMRPAATIAALTGTVPAATQTSGQRAAGGAASHEARASVAEMRRARIASDGLTATKRPGGGVKELLTWGS